MTYYDLVASGYMSKNDLSCAETMLHAANDSYQLGLDEQALRCCAAFGGGMGREIACGALTGGLMALGFMFSTTRSHQDERLTRIRDEYVQAFERHFGSTECAPIKKTHRDPERGCEPVVIQAAQILQRVMDSHEADRNA